jgi:predicted phosphodiesterase
LKEISKQEWVNNICLTNEVINTRTLAKDQIQEWMLDFNKAFNTYVETETFKRYLRSGKDYVREELGLSTTQTRETNVRILPPTKNVGNVLVIGDLHEPFTRVGYREFCLEMKKKHNCQTVVFIGDILDGHYTSFHGTDPDSPYSGIGELQIAKANIDKWHKSFPNAYVTLGNHDSHANRKAFANGISSTWIKSIGDILETSTWTYSDEFTFDDVKYCHGVGRQAESRVKEDMISGVQGHFHSKSYIRNFVGTHKRLFALQIGCGIDDKSFAFAYGKHFSKCHINVGIVKENGTLPIIEYMDLNRDYTV